MTSICMHAMYVQYGRLVMVCELMYSMHVGCMLGYGMCVCVFER